MSHNIYNINSSNNVSGSLIVTGQVKANSAIINTTETKIWSDLGNQDQVSNSILSYFHFENLATSFQDSRKSAL